MSKSWHRKFTLNAEDLKKNNTISDLLEQLKSLLPHQIANSELSIIITEIYNNSLDHGLLNLESSIKQEENGLEKYYNLRKDRLENLTHGMIELDLYYKPAKNLFIVEARDSGNGFDYETFISSPMVYEKHSGKGLYIITKISRDVSYSRENNTLRVEYKIPAEDRVSRDVAHDTNFKATDSLK